MLTDKDAMAISEMIADKNCLPDVREQFKRDLFDYYRDLLGSHKPVVIPTPRRIR